MTLTNKHTRIFKQFFKGTRGNFAIMFAVVVLMLALGVGAAIDISRLSGAKSKL